MDDKIISINVNAAKERIHSKGSEIKDGAKDKIEDALERIKLRLSKRREMLKDKILEKGVDATEKQLDFLNRLRK